MLAQQIKQGRKSGRSLAFIHQARHHASVRMSLEVFEMMISADHEEAAIFSASAYDEQLHEVLRGFSQFLAALRRFVRNNGFDFMDGYILHRISHPPKPPFVPPFIIMYAMLRQKRSLEVLRSLRSVLERDDQLFEQRSAGNSLRSYLVPELADEV